MLVIVHYFMTWTTVSLENRRKRPGLYGVIQIAASVEIFLFATATIPTLSCGLLELYSRYSTRMITVW